MLDMYGSVYNLDIIPAQHNSTHNIIGLVHTGPFRFDSTHDVTITYKYGAASDSVDYVIAYVNESNMLMNTGLPAADGSNQIYLVQVLFPKSATASTNQDLVKTAINGYDLTALWSRLEGISLTGYTNFAGFTAAGKCTQTSGNATTTRYQVSGSAI